MENNDNKLDIEIPHDVAKGSYSNLAIITHSHSEFILDFATMLPGLPKASGSNRLIMTPEHAKRLLMARRTTFRNTSPSSGRFHSEETEVTHSLWEDLETVSETVPKADGDGKNYKLTAQGA